MISELRLLFCIFQTWNDYAMQSGKIPHTKLERGKRKSEVFQVFSRFFDEFSSNECKLIFSCARICKSIPNSHFLNFFSRSLPRNPFEQFSQMVFSHENSWDLSWNKHWIGNGGKIFSWRRKSFWDQEIASFAASVIRKENKQRGKKNMKNGSSRAQYAIERRRQVWEKSKWFFNFFFYFSAALDDVLCADRKLIKPDKL